jgi:hypothetical protein
MTMAEFDRYISRFENYETAEQELKAYNIYSTYEALSKRKEKSKDDLALLYLCKYLINCVENDPKEGDYYNEANNNIMRRAGLLLNEIDGKAYMMDALLAYVPKRYRRSIRTYMGWNWWMESLKYPL